MVEIPYIAKAGALIGDPARANILISLMDGMARTATELAYIAGVSPQTASSHLAKMVEGRFMTMARQGRHRYYRIASPQVMEAIEVLSRLAGDAPPRHRRPGPRDEAMRTARFCYDHFAGRLGVLLTNGLLAQGYLIRQGDDFSVTDSGAVLFDNFGIDLASARGRRRAFARACMDWSERRPHVAGALGAALAARCIELEWVKRDSGSRTIDITEAGYQGLRDTFGVLLGVGRAA